MISGVFLLLLGGIVFLGTWEWYAAHGWCLYAAARAAVTALLVAAGALELRRFFKARKRGRASWGVWALPVGEEAEVGKKTVEPLRGKPLAAKELRKMERGLGRISASLDRPPKRRVIVFHAPCG